MTLELVLPHRQYEHSFTEAQRESECSLDEPFSARVERLTDMRFGRVAPGRVPTTVLWLVEDGTTFLGRISVRHELNDSLRVIGGHIGYLIRASRRGEGLGGKMLAMALPHARALGIDPAMLTCDATNTASWRMIERAGGVRDQEFMHDGGLKYRYWLPTTLS